MILAKRKSVIPIALPAAVIGLSLAAALSAPTAEARVTRIVFDTVTSPAFGGESYGDFGQYETIVGRAFGELDPDDPLNAIIQDIDLAPKNAAGNVEYSTRFFLVKPIDMTKASGLMWQFVPNRGGRVTLSAQLRDYGDAGISVGWQGDNSGGTSYDNPSRDVVMVPIAKNPDGSPITGEVMGRIINAEGLASSQMFVHSNPVPYNPVSLDTSKSTLTIIESETIDGVTGVTRQVPSADWAWARCNNGTDPDFPGTPDPTQICVRGGFEPNRVYQVIFTTQDPPVLGIGFAAFRDVGSFFKYELADDVGTPNPMAGQIHWAIGHGVSQSGNMLRQYLHLGFNEDEMGRQVHDGLWPQIAGRRVALNYRFAMPDGVLKLYEPGSEGPQWWVKWPDKLRGNPKGSILDRCNASHTCPKVIEHFGSAEIWALKLGIEWVGTDAKKDIPLPKNVRRYYIPSTRHGGGNGSFDVEPQNVPSCPSVGYGVGTFPDNPVPHTETRNAIEYHFRNWVMKGTLPPPSRWPLLKEVKLHWPHPHGKHGRFWGWPHRWDDQVTSTLVKATKKAMGFPTIPGVPAWAPTGLVNPAFDYDFGPEFDHYDATGIATNVPPVIRHVIPARVPRVDEDGNELGGVPVVLRDAPLATYMGWNITNGGFHDGKICNYAGGSIPFATTKAERLANHDPRLSLQERYGDHDGYVEAVRQAAAKAKAAGFLLPADAESLIARAEAGDVLVGVPPPAPEPASHWGPWAHKFFSKGKH